MDEKPKCPMSKNGFECGNYDLEKHNAAFLAGAKAQLVAIETAVKNKHKLLNRDREKFGMIVLNESEILDLISAAAIGEPDNRIIEFDEPNIPDGDGFPT